MPKLNIAIGIELSIIEGKSGSSMQLEFPNAAPSFGFSSVGLVSTLLLIVIVSVFFLWVLRRRRAVRSPDNDARDNLLYMKIAYTTERDADGPRQGYLRSLTSDRATLVVFDRAVRKGCQVHLDLGSLGSHDRNTMGPVRGKVTHTKSLDGTPENLLVNIQFLENNIAVHEFRQQQPNFP